METLEGLAPHPAGAALPLPEALIAAAGAWPAPPPTAEALNRLARTLC